MKKSLCDGPGCVKRMMDAPQARFGSKKGAGSCKCGGKCGPCKSKTKAEKDETTSDEPDGDRDDNNGMSPSLTVNRPMPSIMTDAMDTHFYREDYIPACTPGNKPCGKRCIPQDQDCASSFEKKGKRRAVSSAVMAAGALGAGVAGVHLIKKGLKSGFNESAERFVENLTRVGQKVAERAQQGRGYSKKRLEKIGNAVSGRYFRDKGVKEATYGGAALLGSSALGLGAGVQGLRSAAAYGAAKRERNRKDAVNTRNDYIPACTPGNKPCGRRCIPQSMNCDKSEQQRLAKSGFALGVGGLGATAASSLLAASAMQAGENLPQNKWKMPGDFTYAPGQAGYKRALGSQAAQYAGLGLGAASLVQNVRAVKKRMEIEQQSGSKSKKRKDSMWASGFENERSESY